MKRALLIGAAPLALLIAAPAAAQNVAITHAKLVVGDGSGPIDNGTVLIQGGKVVAAGAAVIVPPGTRHRRRPQHRPRHRTRVGRQRARRGGERARLRR